AAGQAAAEHRRAATPAQAGVGGVALGHGDLLGGAHVGDGKQDVGGLAVDVGAAPHGGRGAVAAHAAQRAADAVAAGAGVLRDQVGHQHVVGGAHLAAADVGAAAQVAGGGQVAFGLHALHAAPAVDQGEAA